MSKIGDYATGIGLGLGSLALGAYMMAQAAQPEEPINIAKVYSNGNVIEQMIRDCDSDGELNGRVHMAQVANRANLKPGEYVQSNKSYFIPVPKDVAEGNAPKECTIDPGFEGTETTLSQLESTIRELANR